MPCDAETAQAQLEVISGIVLFVGIMRKSKD